MSNPYEQQPPYEQVREIEHALDYAARYFESHADQRLKTLRYFLIYLLLLAAGLFKVLQVGHYGILAFGSLLGLGVTFFFFSLELRNQQLVSFASEACRELEDELIHRLPKKRDGLAFTKINIVQKSEQHRKWYCYRKSVTLLFSLLLWIQFVFFLLSVCSWLDHEFSIKILPFDIFNVLEEGCKVR